MDAHATRRDRVPSASHPAPWQQKERRPLSANPLCVWCGEPPGTRTPNPLIKSQREDGERARALIPPGVAP
jgi:hypothetical protein